MNLNLDSRGIQSILLNKVLFIFIYCDIRFLCNRESNSTCKEFVDVSNQVAYSFLYP